MEKEKENTVVKTATSKEDLAQIPPKDRFILSINESAQYFHIGVKRMRYLAERNLGIFAVRSGKKYLIMRPKFEEFLENSTNI